VIITAYPRNRRLPVIEFGSLKELNAELGSNDPQDYSEYEVSAATDVESLFASIVAFDWEDPEWWFTTLADFSDGGDIGSVPKVVFLYGLALVTKQRMELDTFLTIAEQQEEDIMSSPVVVTSEQVSDAANEFGNEEYLNHHRTPAQVRQGLDTDAIKSSLESDGYKELTVPDSVQHAYRADEMPAVLYAAPDIADDAKSALAEAARGRFGKLDKLIVKHKKDIAEAKDLEDGLFFCDEDDFLDRLIKLGLLQGTKGLPLDIFDFRDDSKIEEAFLEDAGLQQFEFDDDIYFVNPHAV
jgi:hypothetical protein